MLWATRLLPKRRLRAPLGLALFSGLLYASGFCGFDHSYLAWICLTPALWALDTPRLGARGALMCGWATGFVAHLGVYTWLVGMLGDFAYMPLPVALFAYVVICAVQSLLFAAWGLGVWTLSQRHRMPQVLAAPATMVVCEWCVPALFPSYLANSQYDHPWVMQGCALWGVLGLSFMLTWTSAVCYRALAFVSRRHRRPPTVAVAVWAVAMVAMSAYGNQATATIDATVAAAKRRVTVGLVQTNMGIYEKSENPEEGLRRHQVQSLQAEADGAELIIWPETGYYFALDPDVRNVKRQVMGTLHTPLLFGGLRRQFAAGGAELYNTAFLADAEGALLGRYDKTHLLAFGEYLPFGEAMPWLYRLSPQTLRLWPGHDTQPLRLDELSIGALICYEDLLPRFVRKVMRHRPDVLVSIANDAWFGRTREPRIHLALAAFRAVEQRRFLIRSTNTGISAIVDPAGRILSQTPTFDRANLLGAVVPMSGVTLYQQFGDWPGACSAGMITMFAWPTAWRVLARQLRRLRRGLGGRTSLAQAMQRRAGRRKKPTLAPF